MADATDEPRALLPEHRAWLHAHGISDAAIAARGYYSVTDASELAAKGFGPAQLRTPTLLYPICPPDGSNGLYQHRPDAPRSTYQKADKTCKYENLPRVGNRLDVSPLARALLADRTVPLVVTEGIPKGDCGASRGLCVVALAGVNGWIGTNEDGGKTALPDWRDIPLNDRPVWIVYDSDIATNRQVRRAATELAAYLRNKGAKVVIVELPPGPDGAKVGLDDYLLDHAVADLEALATVEPPKAKTGKASATAAGEARGRTDMANADRLVALHGANIRHCGPWESWLVWDQRRWLLDDQRGVVLLAKETVRQIYREAPDAESREERERLADWAKASESESRLNAMISLARPEVPIKPAALDLDPWLLNVANGTIDLRDGSLRAYQRGDFITKLIDIAYDPDAACPRWLAFLERVQPDAAVRAFLQRAAGYSATGSARERCVIINWGCGQNGKGVFLQTLRQVLGEYAVISPSELFEATRNDQIPADLAQLRGARFTFASETGENRRLDEAKVKKATGGEDIPCRFMHANWFSFKPAFTPWLATNHIPTVTGTDDAIWDRIRLVPWPVRITEAERDTELPAKLEPEYPGILAWIVRGALDWFTHGLGTPDVVRKATKDYRSEMDVLGAFIDECCVVDPAASVTAAGLYKRYIEWADAAGEKALSQKAIGLRLAERGFVSDRVGKDRARSWLGLRLRQRDEPDTAEPTPDSPGGDGSADASDRRTHPDAISGISFENSLREDDFPENASKRVRQDNTSADYAVPDYLVDRYYPCPGCETRIPVDGDCPRCAAKAATQPALLVDEPPPVEPLSLPTDTTYVRTADELATMLAALEAAPGIALDCETAHASDITWADEPTAKTALNPRRGRLRLVQLSDGARCYLVDAFAVDLAPLAALLDGEHEWIGHNIAFDLGWLAACGLPIPDRVYCTMLASQILDAGDPAVAVHNKRHKKPGEGYHSLKYTAARHLGAAVDKAEQLSNWAAAVLTNDQLAYAANDVRLLHSLKATVEAKLAEADLTVATADTMAALPAWVSLRTNGVAFDRDGWGVIWDEAKVAVATGEAALTEAALAAGMTPAFPKGASKAERAANAFRWSAKDRVKTQFAQLGVILPNTQEETLAAHADAHPLVAQYLAWLRDTKACSRDWAQHVDADERIRADYRLLGPDCTRTSCGEPNVQGVPKDAAIRTLFHAAPGHTLLCADWSQLHILILAQLSGDEALRAEYARPKPDIYKAVAARIRGCEVDAVTANERALGKIATLAPIYGQGDHALAEGMAKVLGRPVDDGEATRLRASFFEAFPAVHAYYRAAQRRGGRVLAARSLRHRRRQGVESLPQHLNAPILLSECDCTHRALGLLWERRAQCPAGRLVICCHDELVIEAPPAELDAARAWLAGAMDDALRELLPDVPLLPVEIGVGDTWASAKANTK